LEITDRTAGALFIPQSFLRHLFLAAGALFTFYSVIFLVNLLRVPFYLGYQRYEMHIVVLNPLLDLGIWVAALVLMAVLPFASNVRRVSRAVSGLQVVLIAALVASLLLGLGEVAVGVLIALGVILLYTVLSRSGEVLQVRRGVALAFLALYGMAVLVAVEGASLARWVYHLVAPSPILVGEGWRVAFTEVQMVNILYPVLGALLMFFVFSWVGEFTVKGLFSKGSGQSGSGGVASKPFNSFRLALIILAVALAAGLFINFYHYATAGVFNMGFPSTDAADYIKWLEGMVGMDVFGAFSYAAGNDRFLYLIFQYLLFHLTSLSASTFVVFVMPTILMFLYALSAFLFVKVEKGFFSASTVALISVFAFPVTVSLYGGFYTNWFTLVQVFLFLTLMIMAVRGRRGWRVLTLTGLTSIAVLFTHPWTWIVLMMVLIAYSLITLLMAGFKRVEWRSTTWELGLIATLIGVNVLMYYVRGWAGVGSGVAVGGFVTGPSLNISLLNAGELASNLGRTFNLYLGGFYAYAPLIILSILGVISLLDYQNRYNRLLLAWVLVASSLVFVNYPWHARFLYLTPFNIYAALGLLYIFNHIGSYVHSAGFGLRVGEALRWMPYTLAVLFLFNYALGSVAIKQLGPLGLT